MSQKENYKYVDYLDEDKPLYGQKFVCLSFLSPEGIKNCKLRGLKVRGVYNSKEEADDRCKELNSLDPDFDVFVGEVGKWLPWNPDPTDVKDQVYAEKELNDIMKGYKENQVKAERLESERKSDLLKKAMNEETARNKLDKERDREKLENKESKKKYMDSALSKLQSGSTKGSRLSGKKLRKLKELQKKVKQRNTMADKENEKLTTLNKDIEDEETSLEDVDKNIAKIKKLYKQLKQKQQTKEKSA
jgi:hypothetical protein